MINRKYVALITILVLACVLAYVFYPRISSSLNIDQYGGSAKSSAEDSFPITIEAGLSGLNIDLQHEKEFANFLVTSGATGQAIRIGEGKGLRPTSLKIIVTKHDLEGKVYQEVDASGEPLVVIDVSSSTEGELVVYIHLGDYVLAANDAKEIESWIIGPMLQGLYIALYSGEQDILFSDNFYEFRDTWFTRQLSITKVDL